MLHLRQDGPGPVSSIWLPRSPFCPQHALPSLSTEVGAQSAALLGTLFKAADRSLPQGRSSLL